MAKEWARAFYQSKKWRQCRDSYIQERIALDGGLCEECHNSPGYIVHHKHILTRENISDPMLSLNHGCLEYVCRGCHDKFEGHGLNKSEALLCAFDGDGQPISLRGIDCVEGNRDASLPP